MSKTLGDILEQIRFCEELEIPLPDETAESLKDKIDGYYEVIYHFQALRDSAEAEIDRLDKRVDSFNRNIDKIKSHLAYLMESFGWNKIEGKNVSVSIRESESIDVRDEAKFDDERFSDFARKKVLFAWDKVAIKKAIALGRDLSGLAEVKKKKNIHFK